jgi:hypothetical protein
MHIEIALVIHNTDMTLLHNGCNVDRSINGEAKGIKKSIRCFCRPFMDGRACICLSVSVSVCLS